MPTSSQHTSTIRNVAHQRPLTSPNERPSAFNGPTRSNSSTGIASDHAIASQIPGMITQERAG